MGNLVDVRTSLASIPHIDQILAGAFHGLHRLIPGNYIASNWELYAIVPGVPKMTRTFSAPVMTGRGKMGTKPLTYRTPPTTMPTKRENLYPTTGDQGNTNPREECWRIMHLTRIVAGQAACTGREGEGEHGRHTILTSQKPSRGWQMLTSI